MSPKSPESASCARFSFSASVRNCSRMVDISPETRANVSPSASPSRAIARSAPTSSPGMSSRESWSRIETKAPISASRSSDLPV